MSNWSPEKSAELYGINNWGNGYFRINGAGNVSVTPMGANGPSVDLHELTQDLLDRGIRVPIMIRFPEIIKSRVELLNGCFQKAFADHGYVRSNGGRFVDIYDGKVENIPEEYRIKSPKLYERAVVGRTEKDMER